MILLLDTNAILWFWWDDPQLSVAAKAIIREPANRKLVSPASAWEVAINVSLRKPHIGGPFRGFFQQNMARTNFEWLSITEDHFDIISTLPFYHKDPFDRLLVAQAIVEGIPIVSADKAFDFYAINRVW